MCYSPKLHGNWLVAFTSWEVFCFFSALPGGADVFPHSASQSRGTLAVVERLLSWIFIFLIFFLDSLLGFLFLFLFSYTLCKSKGITILLKATDFPNNFVAKITLRIPSRFYDLCMLSPMCLKQNKTVNHSKINEMVLNAERIWSDLSTVFIFML